MTAERDAKSAQRLIGLGRYALCALSVALVLLVLLVLGGSGPSFSVGTVSQTGTGFNLHTDSAPNAAVTHTIPAAALTRARLYQVTARCEGGTAGITVDADVTQLWHTGPGGVGTGLLSNNWLPGLTGPENTVLTITLSTCGVGNIGHLSTQVERW